MKKGMRMQKANRILQAVHKMGVKRIPLTRIYRNLYCEELFLMAYNKIYRNDGALTPGTEDDTVDGMSLKRIRDTIEALRHERFRFRPSRRTHTNKKDGGKRPLGVPNFTEKLVQEVLRMILEAYYEPRFRDSSHGFRPNRACHTALTQIKQKFRGTVWFIEGDIRGCFDNIDHDILMGILSRDIHDGRLLNLIRMCLEAGYVEDWEHHKTYSGTPQGGILSPLLSNIYLHELDTYIEDVLIPRYTRGKARITNPAYNAIQHQIAMARKRGDTARVEELVQQRRTIPSRDPADPNFRRLNYVRYADDFILGFTGPKSEALAVKAAIGEFLRQKLNLEMSPTKTLITHARTEHALFLGYAISIAHDNSRFTTRRSRNGRLFKARSINSHVRLGIPYRLVKEKAKRYQRNGRPIHEPALLMFSDAQIIEKYQGRFRGLANYYKYAVDRWRLSELKYFMGGALVRTLAGKHKTTGRTIYRKYRGRRRVGNHDYVTLQVEVPTRKGSRTVYWGAISLKTVQPGTEPINDVKYPEYTRNVRSELIHRLQADTCELCGSHRNIQVHHIRKLADLDKPGRRGKPEWMKRMAAMRRKTLIVCRDCHNDIHAGRPTPKSRV
jgi:group II intron reverse transcriptase/maturase